MHSERKCLIKASCILYIKKQISKKSNKKNLSKMSKYSVEPKPHLKKIYYYINCLLKMIFVYLLNSLIICYMYIHHNNGIKQDNFNYWYLTIKYSSFSLFSFNVNAYTQYG